MPWTNRYSGRHYKLTIEPSDGWERSGIVTPKLYRDILTDYLAHEEAKSLDPRGGRCGSQTHGLLPRRPVHARTITHIGKEANQLEDVLTGVADQNETLNQHEDPDEHYFRTIALPILREYGVRKTAQRTGHGIGAVEAVLSGQSSPRPKQRDKYIALADGPLAKG